ncbi:MAG: biotin--[acetyl-CoA-carboxylase] ligase [Leptospirales bacterium]
MTGSFPEPRLVHPDFPLFFLDSVDSTNTFMKEWSQRRSLQQGTALYAGIQTSGRGRPGNKWQHFQGNLALSLWVACQGKTEKGIPWTLKAAFVLQEVLSGLGVPCVLKYPNDIWLKDQTGKIAGILVERVQKGWIIGIGVNKAAPPGLARFGAWEDLPDMHQLAILYSTQFFQEFLSSSSRSLPEKDILERLNRLLLWKGRWVAWKAPHGPLIGKIIQIGMTGQLEVTTPDGCNIVLPETVRSLELLEAFHGQ